MEEKNNENILKSPKNTETRRDTRWAEDEKCVKKIVRGGSERR